MDPTSNATTENLDFLVKGDQLKTSPAHIRDVQDDTTARESIHTDIGNRPIIRDPLVQITDWDSQTLPSQDEESLKRSRYRIGGSADNIVSLTSYQSLLPLEWKVLRSSQSQGTLANFSGVTQQSTDGGYKPTSDNNQDIVDDIIGDEASFKVCTNMLNYTPGTAYIIDSRTAFPRTGSLRSRGSKYPNQSSNGSQCIPVLDPRTEKLPEVGIQFNQAHSSAIDQQDPGLIDQLWTAAASPNDLYDTSASTGWESNSNNHENSAAAVQAVHFDKALPSGLVMVKLPTQKLFLDVNEGHCHYRRITGDTESGRMNTGEPNKIVEPGEPPVQSEFLLKYPTENKQELNQPMKKVQIEGQLLLQGQSLHLVDDGKLCRKAQQHIWDFVKEMWVSPKKTAGVSLARHKTEKDVLYKEESSLSLLKCECCSPVILQQLIVNLKSQISDLQEANETAVLELAKADEEISHLKNEMAQLKSEYLQKIADIKEENLILKKKINRMHNRHDPVHTYEQALHEEICELRSESRRLREASHQLNEENHRLKEELWDVKRQYEWLMHTVTGRQDERVQERSRNNASPSSINSESTEILIAGYCDIGLAKENRDLKDDASERKTKVNSNNIPCISQHNQTSHENANQNILSSTSNSFSQVDTCSKYFPNRVHMNKTAPSRRPFAPRSVADLKVGNLVKFSRPTGKISKGTVKYLGPLFGREEDCLGIELEGDQVGRHDGTFQGTRYFLCEPNKGVFVNFSKVIIAWE